MELKKRMCKVNKSGLCEINTPASLVVTILKSHVEPLMQTVILYSVNFFRSSISYDVLLDNEWFLKLSLLSVH